MYALASLGEFVALNVVAQQNRNRLGLTAVLAPAWVRAVVVQPVLLRDHLGQRVQRYRIFGIFLNQLQESQRQIFNSLDYLLSLLLGRGVPIRVRSFVEFLENRLVLLRRRLVFVLALGRQRESEHKNACSADHGAHDVSSDCTTRLATIVPELSPSVKPVARACFQGSRQDYDSTTRGA